MGSVATPPPERRRRRLLRGSVTSLMYAAQQGDVDRVRKICRTQPSTLLCQDRTGKSALHYCCTSDSNRAAQAADLIAMAAPELVETRDEDGFTPLHLAVIAGNTKLVTFLLANGADVTAVDNEKHTVVHWATVCGETTALRAVLTAGAPVTTPDVHGGYPLHYAAQMCGGEKDSELGLQVLQTLLAHKDIDVAVEDGDKRQPLLWAASAGSAKAILSLIRAGAAVEASDRDGLTALHCAASRGHTDCLDTLLTLCGATPDVIDSNGCTALHYAVTLGHADATVLLLTHQADPNRQDRKGRTAAHCGCAKGQFETVKLIGSRGANLWMRNARGDLPLHEAAASGRRELVAWLLSMRPSQANARNNDGRTPLHMAALNDNVDMCKILLDSGAAINPILRTSKNVLMTPLDCALQRGYRSTAKYLQLHGGVPATRLGPQQSQVTSALSLQIRDDVTFWDESTSDSEERDDGGAKSASATKRKSHFKSRKKKKQQQQQQHQPSGTETKTTATNTSADGLDPKKPSANHRIDYSNEIIINGKTEINIHHTEEIVTVHDGDGNADRVEAETITVPSGEAAEKRPKSAAKVSKEKSIDRERDDSALKPPSPDGKGLRRQSTATSDETLDTVIDNYKQKVETLKEEMRQSSKERIADLREASNTSEEVETPHEMVVEASVHAEPKKVTVCDGDGDNQPIKGILKAAEEAKPTPDGAEDTEILLVEDPKTAIDPEGDVQNEPAVEEKECVSENNAAVDSSQPEQPESNLEKPPASEENQTPENNKPTTTPSEVAETKKEDDAKRKKRTKKPNDQPAILKVLKPGEKVSDVLQKGSLSDYDDDDDHDETVSSDVFSDSMDQASKEHKSFKVLSEQEAKELEKRSAASKRGKSKEPRSKSEESILRKNRKARKSKIPTPTFQTHLSKSERHLDKLVGGGGNAESRIPSLPNIHEATKDRVTKDQQQRPDSNLSAPILPSVYSDNERDSVSDLEDPRLSPAKRKKVKKRPKTRRRESKSAGSDYESSNLIDSGFEPSPRLSSRIPKWKNVSDRGVNMTSVTRSIQGNIRRYHLERKIFQHLLDLKRSQIRAGQHNESVLVKRAIDHYNQTCASTVGAGRYVPDDFSFRSFERFLYESLRKLQKIDVAYLKGLPETAENVNPLLCTQSTHRCMHAAHAYTGVPCAAYLPKMDHHSVPKIGFEGQASCKPGTAGFLPSIGSGSNGGSKKAVTLELSHGSDKQVISLPTDKLDQNKRYYVTFTVKGEQEEGDGGSSEEATNRNRGHVHSKSD